MTESTSSDLVRSISITNLLSQRESVRTSLLHGTAASIFNRRRDTVENDYLSIRMFKNGNAKGQRGDEGASAAPTGCASNVDTEK